MSGQAMDGLASFADQLMNSTSQLYTQGPQSNLSQMPEEFQTALQDYQLPPHDSPQQPYENNPYQQEITEDQNFPFNTTDIFDKTPSLEAFLDIFQDLSNPTDIDNINPSIAQLTRQPAVQPFGFDTEFQHQRVPIQLPDSPTDAPASTICAPLAMQQGTLESLTATRAIAVINPLTNEMASSVTAATITTNVANHVQNHASAVPAQVTQPVIDHSQVAIPAADQVSPTLATTVASSDHPAVQSNINKKPKSKKKRRRAERKTPNSSPSSSLVLDMKKQKTVDDSKAKEEYRLPPGSDFRIQLSYQKYKFEDKTINSQDGFLVYHEKAWKFPDNGSKPDPTKIEFPRLEENSSKFKMTNSQRRSTEELLAAMSKGVHIYHDENQNIFVERYCRSHVFCYTTDLGEGDITNNVLQRPDLLYQIKLEQGKKIKVFDYNSLWKKAVLRAVKKEKIPSPPPFLILSFGQTWQEGFPLSNNLVYVKITPSLPREQYSFEHTPSFDYDGVHLLTSMSSLSLNSR